MQTEAKTEEIQHPDVIEIGTMEEPNEVTLDVTDDKGATMLIRNMAHAEKEIARLNEYADSEIKRMTSWRDEQIERIERHHLYFRNLAESYMRDVYEKTGGKTKTLKLIGGQFQIRKLPDKIKIDEAFKPEENKKDKFVVSKTTYRVDLKSVMDNLKVNGELPDYAEVVEGDTKFKVIID